MISSYKKLTGKYLKANKKRTILTIIGIILSVALISSIGLFFKGIQVAQTDDIKNNYGSFHLIFQKADESLINKIASNPKVSRSGLVSMGEAIKLEEKLSISEMRATDKALELLPYKVKEGKLPENKNEAAIEKWVLRKLDNNAKIGDTIKIKDKEYILAGILEDNVQNQVNGTGVLLSKGNDIDKSKAMLLVEISSKTNLRAAVKEIKQLGTKDTVAENTLLLVMQGAGDDANQLMGLYITLAIIIGIVLISTIAVIYNSFQISVVERVKQFGLMRAVGATPRQIRSIVLREATLLAIIGVPIGLLCGIVAIYGISIAFNIIGGDSIKIMKPYISPAIMALSASVGLLAIYISALIPAFFAGRISPLVAISSRASITKEKIKRRKNTITGKIFGFEGALAEKNMKRNKKRYRITIFSIIISVVLFITFKSFMDMTLKITTDVNESTNVHFSVVRDNTATSKNVTIDNETIEKIKALKSVDKLYKVYAPSSFYGVMEKGSEIKEVQDLGGVYTAINHEGREKTLVNSAVVAYDQASLEVSRKYLEAGNIDASQLNSENGVILINKNKVHNSKTDNNYYGVIANIKVGDEIYVQYIDPANSKLKFGEGKPQKVKVLGILKNDPFNFRGDNSVLKLITTEDMFKKLTGKSSIGPINLNIMIKDVNKAEEARTQIENVVKATPSLNLVNIIDQNKNGKSALLMIQILIYGFVIVVSLIGSVNIVNTLTTNIILRKREFAALKSIGLTQKGLKKMIVLEGLFYGIAGTVYGSVIGSGLSFMLFRGLSTAREFAWRIPWNAIGIAAVCAMIIGYVSVLSPLGRIKRENLIEAIREE